MYGLNQDVQDVVELYHYIGLEELAHQVTKVEN